MYYLSLQIKLKEAENEDTIKVLSGKICESEMVREMFKCEAEESLFSTLLSRLMTEKIAEMRSQVLSSTFSLCLNTTLDINLVQECKTQREDIPEDSIASLQEELAASKLREAESNLALKDLRSKVGELNTMWLKHIKSSESNSATPSEMPSTPKKVHYHGDM